MARNQLLCSLVLVLTLLGPLPGRARSRSDFVRTNGTRFVANGRELYPNGFNAYWMMVMALEPSQKEKVTLAFRQASDHGMTLARTWAFSDGEGYGALQYSPGFYDENTFKGLDFVISEAKKYGVYLILSLVNNYDDYGGKRQYVQWARESHGQQLSSDDDFYRNEIVKGFYKNHVKTVLTRINTITGVAYKDDPTIFAWELINEPRCETDLSGRTFQAWITEMSAYVKSIDSNHLLEVGLEGFYGKSTPERLPLNINVGELGTDFISNNKIPNIDFTTIHAYPDQWMPAGSSDQEQLAFFRSWIGSHAEDSDKVLKKPLLITEFGHRISSKPSGCDSSEIAAVYKIVYGAVYASARDRGPCVGSLFWQLLVPGMDEFRDGYEMVFSECPTTANFISFMSLRISSLAKDLYSPRMIE